MKGTNLNSEALKLMDFRTPIPNLCTVVRRLEYDKATMTPKGFYVNLFTPKARERALAWNGALMVKAASVLALLPPAESRPYRSQASLLACLWRTLMVSFVSEG